MFFIVSVLFLGVTLGQILLFQGKKPREASLVAGGVIFPLAILALGFYYDPARADSPSVIGMIFCSAVAGAPLGYLAGCIMAGVFFVQERFRRRSRQPVKIELLPFTAADFEPLIAWVHHPQLFDLWSHGRFRYPLDHEQLAVHLNLAVSAPPDSASASDDGLVLLAQADPSGVATPNRLYFKAVCGEMQQMVAYAELSNIDGETSRASVELAIVDPSRNDRDQLSDALVWEIMQQAFTQQGLQWLGVVLHRSAAESLECFRKHGFYDPYGKMPSDASRQYLKLIRSSRY